MTEPLSLHYATSSMQYMTPHYQGHPLLSSRVSPFRATTTLTDREYKDLIKTTRYYYRVDPIASVVIDRLAEIAATEIRIKPQPLQGDGDVSDDVLALYRAVAGILQQAMIPIITSYLVDGMAAPQYELVRLMGNRVSGALGRTRYFVPSRIWVRDTLQIELQPNVLGGEPLAFVRVPPSDVQFITSNGVYPNGVKDEKTFRLLLEQYPDYVKKIKAGETLFPLTTPVIYRNLVSSFLYPKPYLEPALEPLQRKHLLHRLDRSLVQRTIETFRHIKAGSDKYPA
ncbi:MAG: hypothetical protein N2385_14485, partial [Chloroflexus sp.]|nr:hypothetical protein [Chloroflexus sp.]